MAVQASAAAASRGDRRSGAAVPFGDRSCSDLSRGDRPLDRARPATRASIASTYYRRGDLEDPFFSDRFPAIFASEFLQNFGKFSQISLKYENLGITLSEIIEILRNSGKN